MTDEEKTAAHTAVQMLAGVCDGTFQPDGMGFNRPDARTGKALAMLDGATLTPRQAAYCERLAMKYSKQTGFQKPMKETQS